jgi:hypothetical protein
MAPDDQPATPAGLRPETAVICAGRPSRAASEPLNIPVVLASNFHASTTAAPGMQEGIRSYARTERSKLPGQGHVPPGLLRLSAGCEHIDDLWNDLNSALEQASRPDNPA